MYEEYPRTLKPYRAELTTAPTIEPVTLASAKAQTRVDFADDDDLLNGLIVAARETVEGYLRRALLQQTWTASFVRWPWCKERMVLIRPPVLSVQGVHYYDASGNAQSLDASDYFLETNGLDGLLTIKENTTLPELDDERVMPVSVTYRAGYGTTAGDVPQAIRQAILLLVSHWYEHRLPVVSGVSVTQIPKTVEYLLARCKLRGWSI